MKNSKLLTSLLLATAVLTPTAQAQIEANVALTTDYVWRGISQSNEDLAIQGGFDYSHETGFYVGLWGSNVDFVGPASLELDLYGGWAYEFNGGFGIDIGVIEYSYHGGDDEEVITNAFDIGGASFVETAIVSADDLDFTEVYVGISYAGLGITYYAGEDDFDDNIEVSYGYDFDGGFSLGATYGDYDSYSYYQVSGSYEIGGVNLSLAYTDTDDDGEDLAGELAEGRVVFTVSKSF